MRTGTANDVTIRGKGSARKYFRLLLGGVAATTALVAVGATVVAAHAGSASPRRSSPAAGNVTGSPTSRPASHKAAASGEARPATAKSIPYSGPSRQSVDYSFLTPSTGNLISNINAALGETGDIVGRIDNGRPLTDKEYSDGKAAYDHPVDYDLQESLRSTIDRINGSIANITEVTTYGQTQVDGNGDLWYDLPSGWWSPTSSLTTPPFLFSDALTASQSVAH